MGLLGEKFVEIVPGESATIAGQGDVLAGLPAAGFDQIGTLLRLWEMSSKRPAGRSKRCSAPKPKTNLNQALENLAALSAELKDLIGRNQREVQQTVQSAGRAFENLDNSSRSVSAAAQDALQPLKDMAAENRENIKLNLEKIKELIGKIQESVKLLNSSLEKINSGEGRSGKPIQDPELYTKPKERSTTSDKTGPVASSLRALMDFQADYYGRSGLVRSSYSLGFGSSPRSFSRPVSSAIPGKAGSRSLSRAVSAWGLRPQGGLHRIRIRRRPGLLRLRDRLVLERRGL